MLPGSETCYFRRTAILQTSRPPWRSHSANWIDFYSRGSSTRARQSHLPRSSRYCQFPGWPWRQARYKLGSSRIIGVVWRFNVCCNITLHLATISHISTIHGSSAGSSTDTATNPWNTKINL